MKICGIVARWLVATASALAVVATSAAAELPGLPAQVVTITPPVATFPLSGRAEGDVLQRRRRRRHVMR